MLFVLGSISAIIWALVTWISLGVPAPIFRFVDQMTFHQFTVHLSKIQNGFDYDVRNADMPTIVFLVLFVLAFVIYGIAIKYVERQVSLKSTWIIVGFAIAFRLILLPSYPVHENDIYRYLWDGKQIKYGVNPFQFAPQDIHTRADEQLKYVYRYDYDQAKYLKSTRIFTVKERVMLDRLEEAKAQHPKWFSRIGHQWVPTIYPPTAQGVFWLSALIAQDSLWFLKAVFVLFDIGVVLLLLALLKRFDLSPALVIVYAWSPLILKEFANSGHYDPIAIFFMMFFFYCVFRKQHVCAMTSFVAAGLAKFFCFLIAPLFWTRFHWKHIALGVALVVTAYFPFLLWNDVGRGVLTGLNIYSHLWTFNGALFTIIRWPFEALGYHSAVIPKLICSVLLIGYVLFLARKPSDDDRALLFKSFCVIAALFLLNPVGDPWYYSWVMPFLCFFRYRSFILLSGLLIFSYLSFITDWGRWLMLVQYVPFYVLFIWEVSRSRVQQS